MITNTRILSSIILFFSFVFTLYGQIVPYDTLYDQTSTPSGGLKVSTHFYEIGYETNYSCDAADDFVNNDQWTITKVTALGGYYNGSINPRAFNVVIYANDGELPGAELYNYHTTADTSVVGAFTIPIDEDIVLPAGHYWISVSANTQLGHAQWGWKPSTGPYNYEAVWINPSNGFGTGFTTWTPITTVWPGTSENDFSFMLFGINGIPASDPDPADGELAVQLDKDISWSNPGNAVSIEVFWGTEPDSLISIYSGSPITTIEQGQMEYNTEYYWRIDVNDGDGVATGKTWHFSTIQDPSIVLNENFDDWYFPPDGWVVESTGEPLWKKGYGTSAFGQGAHSLRCGFFSNYPPDSIGNLITHTFDPLLPGDSLSFDHAYAPDDGGHDDQLEISYSTDGGENWETLVLLHGGFGGELVTAPPTYLSFIPDPDQWGTLKFAVPAGTNKFKFKAIDRHGNDLYLDNIIIIGSDGQLTSVSEIKIPREFSLQQNYPNPFNPTTTIEYALPENEIVRLEVYNSLGQKVKVLVNGYQAAGTHRINFDASDLSSGIYYYRIKAGKFQKLHKMILIR